MHVNATFLIQMINFFITYMVLHLLLFKPAIASLKAKEEKQKTLEESIKREEAQLYAFEKEKHDNIATFQTEIKKEYPFISPRDYQKPPEIAIKTKEKIDTEKLKEQVTALLVKEVPHVY